MSERQWDPICPRKGILSNHPNLFMCITSRPEQDIQAVLNPLTSASSRVPKVVKERISATTSAPLFVRTER